MMMRSGACGDQSGLSLLELLLVLAIVAVVASMAFMQIASARERTRLDQSARELAGNLEKTRLDSIRRHAPAAQQASVTVTNASSYRVVADYNFNGSIDTGEGRTFTLPQGVTFVTSPTPPAASFDWQGRLAADMSFRLTNSSGTVSVNLTTSGDATLNGAPTLPTISVTPFPAATATPTPSSTPTPTPIPPSGVGGCNIGPYPESFSIRKSGKETGIIDLLGSIYGDPGTATIDFDSSRLKITYGSPLQTAKPGDVFNIGPATPVRFYVVDIKGAGQDYTTNFTVTSDCGTFSTAVTVTIN
jgi:prepilin-type N-terminal cleavage/methylation domain-containing protein